MSSDVKKGHRPQKSGAKVKKKQAKEGKERHNAKAFTFSGGWRSVQRNVQRSAEISEKREKFERYVDKAPSDCQPPYIVAVQGPSGCGKSTLIKSLVKHYTKQSVTSLAGPITMVVSKSRRLTFVEVPDDVGAMIDLCKVADLAIIMVNAEHGLEMPTFEFISMLQTHGFPRILGVLSKLDSYKDNKSLKKLKKTMKHRFWTEIYDGAKLFYLSGLKGKRYLKREILNLSRFIGVQKYQPLFWKSTHPYILPLGIEVDPFSAERDANETRAMTFSGYVKGCRLREGQMFHIPGAGDFSVAQIVAVPDPCPLPTKNLSKQEDAAESSADKVEALFEETKEGSDVESDDDARAVKQSGGKMGSGQRRNGYRRLKQQERVIYAPLCDVGQVEVEGSNVFINLPNNRVAFTPAAELRNNHEDCTVDARASNISAADQEEESKGGSDTDWTTSSDESERKDSEEEDTDDASSVSSDNDAGKGGQPEDLLKMEATANGMTSAIRKMRVLHRAEGAFDAQIERSQLKIWHGASSSVKADRTHSRINDTRALSKLLDGNDEMSADDWKDFNRENLEVFSEAPKAVSEKVANGKAANEKAVSDDEGAGKNDESDTSTVESDNEAISRLTRAFGTIDDQSVKRSAKKIDWSTLVYAPETLDPEARQFYKDIMESTSDDAVASKPIDLFDAEDDALEISIDTPDVCRISDKLRFRFLKSLPVVAYERKSVADADDKGEDESDANESDANERVVHDLLLPPYADILPLPRMRALRSLRFIVGGWDSGPSRDDPSGLEAPATIAEFDKQNFEKKKARLIEGRANNAEAEKVEQECNEYPIGTFVRVTVHGLPEKWIEEVTKFDGRRPVVLGGVLMGEQKLTFMSCKVKRHRYAPNILKSTEPLMFSMGWRRFQSLPYFAIEDRNDVRIRYLKYTPEHMHCLAYIYGHAAPPSSGVLAIKHYSRNVADFRVSLTGSLIENDPNPKVMKKLKFIGSPLEIKKNTAFITNMFTSDLEVAKVQGVGIQTQSGIRGIIKKPKGQNGDYRATFEAQIRRSDIIICKAWYRVPLEPFCNPVMDTNDWERVRTFAEIRQELNQPTEINATSRYTAKTQIEPVKVGPLRVPKRIRDELPFKSIPKPPDSKTEAEIALAEALKPERSEHEQYIESLLAQAARLRKAKLQAAKEKQKVRIAEKAKTEAKAIEQKRAATKDKRKLAYISQGKDERMKRRRMRLE